MKILILVILIIFPTYAFSATCTKLHTIISTDEESCAIKDVSCKHGYHDTTINKSFSSKYPAVVITEQSTLYGPKCTITVNCSNSNETGVVSVH